MMKAASFFSPENAQSAAVASAERDSTTRSYASASTDADAFAALVDDAFVRAAFDATNRPPTSAQAASSAATAEVPQSELPESVPAEAATASEVSGAERPKSETALDLNALLVAQSFFVAPTLPVTWVVPAEPPPHVRDGNGGDESLIAAELPGQGVTQPGGSVPVETVAYSSAPGGSELAGESGSSKTVGPAFRAGEEVPGVSSREKASSQNVITSNRPTGKVIDPAALGLQPVAEAETRSLTEWPDAPSPLNPIPAPPVTVTSGLASTSVQIEGKTDGEAVSSQSFLNRQSDHTEMQQPRAARPPTTSAARSTTGVIPASAGVDVVMANALQVTTSAVESVTRSQTGASSDIPMPVEEKATANTVTGAAEQGTSVAAATEAELPGATEEAAILAQSPQEQAASKNDPYKSKKPVQPASGAGFLKVEAAPAPGSEARGIPVAKQEERMESLSNAEQAGAGPMTGGTGNAAEENTSSGPGPLLREHAADNADFSRSLATDWQPGRPVSSSDRPAPDSETAQPPEVARNVEHLSGLISRETAVLKLHSPDSMSVVLRPDANTELFLHLTQRDGQIEASVCCERGDFHQLNALWSQLQESLAGQKVRLAPLQEGTSAQQHNGSGQDNTPGNAMNFSESDRHSRRPSMPEDESMSGRPSSAPSSTVSHHPERRRSGTRPTTSRPGWETWA